MKKIEKFKGKERPFVPKDPILCLFFASCLLSALICLALGAREGAWFSLLSALLSLILPITEALLSIRLPIALKLLSLSFILAANLLGELFDFYTRIPFWDSLLHLLAGAMFSALGFAFCERLTKDRPSAALVFCFSLFFSVTVGVAWEFAECFFDLLLKTDMQKDSLVRAIHSIKLDKSGKSVIGLSEIEKTLVYFQNGESIALDGYLDIGLYDTVKDLALAFLGALGFSLLGYLETIKLLKSRLCACFIPTKRS